MSVKPSYRELERRVKELEQAEEELRDSEAKYRQLVEAADAVIFIANYDGTYIYMNELAAKQLGGRPNDFIGQNVFDFFPQEMAEYFLSGIRNIINSGEGNIDESETLLKGERHWYKTIGKPLADKNGKIYAAMFIGIDETLRKNAEEEREKLINELQEALKEIKTLRGIIPICSQCKKVRDDEGAWDQMEKYISERSDVQFSHSICPKCKKKLYPHL